MKIAHIKISGGQNDVIIAHGVDTAGEGDNTVTFDRTLPHTPVVKIEPIGNNAVWLISRSTNNFVWRNNEGEEVTIDWLAVC